MVLRDYNAAVVKVPTSIILLKCIFPSVMTVSNISLLFFNRCPYILMGEITFTKLGCVDETVFEQNYVSFFLKFGV